MVASIGDAEASQFSWELFLSSKREHDELPDRNVPYDHIDCHCCAIFVKTMIHANDNRTIKHAFNYGSS